MVTQYLKKCGVKVLLSDYYTILKYLVDGLEHEFYVPQ